MKYLLLLMACACGPKREQHPPASPEEVTRLGKLADEMIAASRATDAKRTAALQAALRTLGPRPDLGGCPVKVPVVESESMKNLGARSSSNLDPNWRSVRAEQMMVVDADKLATTQSVRQKNIEQMIASERERLDGTNAADTEKWLRYYGDPKNYAWEMVIVATKHIAPTNAVGGKFTEGIVEGVAFVYSHVDNKIVCAAEVAAQSSSLLRTAKATEGFELAFDLDNEAFRAAAQKLVAAGPLQ